MGRCTQEPRDARTASRTQAGEAGGIVPKSPQRETAPATSRGQTSGLQTQGISVRGWLSAAQVLVLCYVRSAGRESHGSFLCTQLCLPSNSYVDTLSPKGLYVEMGVFGMVTGLSEVISAGP